MVKIYVNKDCKYCTILEEKLTKLEINYFKYDVNDEERKESIEKIYKFVGEPIVPIIIVDKHLLVPKRSFNTIDEAITLIQSLIE